MGGGGGGVGLGVGLPVGIEVVGSALVAVALPLGVIGLTYAAARGIFASMVRKRKRALDTLMLRLTGAVEHELGQAGERALSPPKSPPS